MVFLAGTFNGTNMHFYVNGQEVAGSPKAASMNYANIRPYLSRVNNSSINPYKLDDVRIYNRALSAAEIQAMYNAGK